MSDVLILSGTDDDRAAAARLVAGEDGKPPRYEVRCVAEVGEDHFPDARTVVLWHCGADAQGMQAVGERLHHEGKTVKFLTGPGPVELSITAWEPFLAWAKPRIRLWDGNGAFREATGLQDAAEHRQDDDAPTEPVGEPEGCSSPDEPPETEPTGATPAHLAGESAAFPPLPAPSTPTDPMPDLTGPELAAWGAEQFAIGLAERYESLAVAGMADDEFALWWEQVKDYPAALAAMPARARSHCKRRQQGIDEQAEQAPREVVDVPAALSEAPDARGNAVLEALESIDAPALAFGHLPALDTPALERTPRDAWPAPVDFWGDAESLPEVPFASLPPAIAPYLFDQSALRGVDPCQAAVSCVVSCSALLRESICLQMKGDNAGWREHARLWGAVIGDPSTRKKVGMELGATQLKHLALNFRAAEERAISDHMHADKIYQGQLLDYYRDAKKNPGQPRPEPPDRPLSNRLWTDSATLESLAKLLSHHARGKVCVIKDELAAWFGEFDCYGNGKSDKDRPAYLSAYEGGETYIDRATEGKSFHVPTWSLSILGGIQPDKLAAIANKLGSDGMLQRFMLATSKPARRDEERATDKAAEGRWQAVCAGLLEMELHPNSGPVRLSPDAQAYRRECSDWFDQGMRAGFTPALTFALGKWEGLLGRLALTFHCIEAADKGLAFPDATVPYATLELAFSYIKDFLWPHALHFYQVAQDDVERVPLKKIAGIILVHGDGHSNGQITRSDIGHAWTGWRKLGDHQKREIMGALSEAGWLRPQGSGTYWQINPACMERFAGMAERIKKERAAQAALMGKRLFERRQPGEEG